MSTQKNPKTKPTMDKHNHRLTGKIIVRAKLRTSSPLRIGSGKNDQSHVDILRWPGTDACYIPASSLVGALAHRFVRDVHPDRVQSPAAEIFWGHSWKQPKDQGQAEKGQREAEKESNNNGKTGWKRRQSETYQSHFQVADMQLEGEQRIVVRDGVRIDPATNTAEEGGKYDYELLEPGNEFTFTGEITLRQGFADQFDEIKKIVSWIKHVFENEFCIGGLTTRGFGELELVPDSFRAIHFDFGQGTGEEPSQAATDADNWFEYLKKAQAEAQSAPRVNLGQPSEATQELEKFLNSLKGREIRENLDPDYLKPDNTFRIDAQFNLTSSFLIGSPPGIDDDAKNMPLKSGDDFILSGKSLAGALRHRALKILNTLEIEGAEEKIRDLFGHVDNETRAPESGPADGQKGSEAERSGAEQARKSRIKTYETKFNKDRVEAKNQTRIRIDRFTGGTIRGALFSEAALWRKSGSEGSPQLPLKYRLTDPKPWEPALLLHLLKDLWTGDLAIGSGKSIGRGTLQGVSAKISFGNHTMNLIQKKDGLLDFEPEGETEEQRAATEKAFRERLGESEQAFNTLPKSTSQAPFQEPEKALSTPQNQVS